MSAKLDLSTDWHEHYKAVRRRIEGGGHLRVPPQAVRRLVDDIVAKRKAPVIVVPVMPPGEVLLYDRPIGPTKCGFLGLDGEPVVRFQYKPREIVAQVAHKHRFALAELMSDRRSGPLVLARQIAMYRLSKECTWSTVRIGRYFGGRDHTTALHAIRKIERLVAAGELVL